MTDEQQIEEMAKIIDDNHGFIVSSVETAEALHNAGYRKASEVAEEIFGELEAIFNGDGFHYFIAEPIFAELKKKYTEGKG